MAIVSWRDNAADSWSTTSALASFLSLCPGHRNEGVIDGHQIKPSEFCGCCWAPPYTSRATRHPIAFLSEEKEIWTFGTAGNVEKFETVLHHIAWPVVDLGGLLSSVADPGSKELWIVEYFTQKEVLCQANKQHSLWPTKKMIGFLFLPSLIPSSSSSSEGKVQHERRLVRPSLRSFDGVSLSGWTTRNHRQRQRLWWTC